MNKTIEEKRKELQALIEEELIRLDKIIDDKQIELQNLIRDHSNLEELLGRLEE